MRHILMGPVTACFCACFRQNRRQSNGTRLAGKKQLSTERSRPLIPFGEDYRNRRPSWGRSTHAVSSEGFAAHAGRGEVTAGPGPSARTARCRANRLWGKGRRRGARRMGKDPAGACCRPGRADVIRRPPKCSFVRDFGRRWFRSRAAPEARLSSPPRVAGRLSPVRVREKSMNIARHRCACAPVPHRCCVWWGGVAALPAQPIHLRPPERPTCCRPLVLVSRHTWPPGWTPAPGSVRNDRPRGGHVGR